MKEIVIWESIKKQMSEFVYTDFTRMESWIKSGVPDINGCYKGTEIWIEAKACNEHGRVVFRKMQIPWMIKRRRSGGQVFIAVVTPSGELLIYDAAMAMDLDEHGVFAVNNLLSCQRPWHWPHIMEFLTENPLPNLRG